MYAGEKCTLKMKVTPSKANKKVTWQEGKDSLMLRDLNRNPEMVMRGAVPGFHMKRGTVSGFHLSLIVFAVVL